MRGLSAVVTQLIMILIAVSLMTGAAAYNARVVGPLESAFNKNIQQTSDALRTTVLIEDVWFYTDQYSVKKVQVTLFNYGDLPATVSDAFINGAILSPPPPTGVSPLRSAVLTWSYAWIAGTSYQIKIVTTDGNNYSTTASA